MQPEAEGFWRDIANLKLSGPPSAEWKTTRCEFHGGSDSMRVNVRNGAWKCMSCFEGGGDVLSYHMRLTGAEFIDACKELGCWVDDGKSPVIHKPTPLSPRQALSVLKFEATLAAVAAGNVSKGITLSAEDLRRLFVCAGRINVIAEAY